MSIGALPFSHDDCQNLAVVLQSLTFTTVLALKSNRFTASHGNIMRTNGLYSGFVHSYNNHLSLVPDQTE
jgi:hypothetical protein